MGKKAPWWQETVVYQIYPRSFQDSDGDGIGDLPGIISRLDYLQKLGIGAIWLSPVYQSPNDDNGYDISDNENIMTEFGTMADMDRLIAEAAKREIRIVMDLVVNHTSDEHAWFVEARKSKDNPYRDYYIWRDGREGGTLPPDDMESSFSTSAWEFDATTGQYFLHLFSKKQPDLNWENPRVHQEVYQMMNFWLEKGIGGFRLDVIDMIGKIPDQQLITNGPRLHEYLQEMNQATFGKYDVMTVGEAWSATPEIAKLYSNPERDELSMVFQFGIVRVDQQPGKEKWDLQPVNVGLLKEILSRWQVELGHEGWNSLFWSNHDLPRAISRFGSEGQYREKSGKALAILLHFLKGTPYIYQGEEIGMINRHITTLAEVHDIESVNMVPERLAAGYAEADIINSISWKGRDTGRSPLLWSDAPNAGFTTGTPWLSITQNYHEINAEKALADPDSIFYTYQKLIALRKKLPLISRGDYHLLTDTPEKVFAYKRSYEGQQLLVVVNLSEVKEHVKYAGQLGEVLISNQDMQAFGTRRPDDDLSVEPYGAFAVWVE